MPPSHTTAPPERTCIAGVLLRPLLSRLQDRPGLALLRPPPGVDLSLRVAELSASRAAALDAHAAELRRIERSLHDGSQNRLVAVTVLVGAARRAPARAGPAAVGRTVVPAPPSARGQKSCPPTSS